MEILGLGTAGRRTQAAIFEGVRHVLRMDEDLSAFYGGCLAGPDLAWAATGAGRMLRSPTVFEDVVKTICTTNCAWGATVRSVNALVGGLGDPPWVVVDAAPDGWVALKGELVATGADGVELCSVLTTGSECPDGAPVQGMNVWGLFGENPEFVVSGPFIARVEDGALVDLARVPEP